MMITGRSIDHSRVWPLAILTVCLLVSGCSVAPPLRDPADLRPAIVLHSLEARRAPDDSRTTVTLHGNLPMSYAMSPLTGDSWSLTLEGVDPTRVVPEVEVESPQVERIQLRTVPGLTGPSTKIDFEGGNIRDRKIRLDGNDLVVELAGHPPTPAVSEPPAPSVSAPAPGSEAAVRHGEGDSTTPGAGAGYRLAAATFAPLPVDLASPPAGALDLSVAAGKSLTLPLDSPVTRVSVANPQVADAVVISPQQLLINGLAPGTTSLVLWFRSGESKNYNLSVQVDTQLLATRLQQFFPQEKIGVGASKDTLVLYGTVSRPEIGDKAAKIAADYTGKVVNNLTYPPTGRRQILLKVMFAEVNRLAITELSASFVRVDPDNPRGDHEGLSNLGKPGALGNLINSPRGPDFNFNDAINIYAFNFRDKIAGFITALKTRGLLQVLAEPNLIAADGQKASFLAGGEFPIPVAQAGAGFTSVTIVFKKFGISLDFTPEIRDDGTIVLKVEPEVSSLDFANAVVLSGFTIPSLKVRRASTEVELKDGQSFAIAGLYSADLQQTKRKIPVLGDIPLLGYLFRSKSLNKNQTELLVIATPTLVEPLPAGEKAPLPEFDLGFEVDRKKTPEKP